MSHSYRGVSFTSPESTKVRKYFSASSSFSGDLTTLMEATVTKGTARRIFRERGMGVPGAVGKTGTLADRKPFCG